jgi:NTE family protein
MLRGVLAALVLIHAIGARALEAQSCPATKTALVLSGGGVKGLAHIGVLRALDSLGVVPDLVVGTSMGAIVGAMYASGVDGASLDSLVRSVDLEQAFQSYDLHGPQRLRGLAPLVIWERGSGGVEIQNASVSESAVNFLLGAALLDGGLLARGQFDSLPIPYRAVATNLATRQSRVFASGDLAQVVRASMAVPVVFEPVGIDGDFFTDGGLSQNIPVAAARQAGATRVIVSDVTSGTPDSLNPYSAIAVGEQLINYLFTQDLDTLPGDLYLKIDLAQVRSLDLSRRTVANVLDEGHRIADSALGARLDWCMTLRNAVVKTGTPPVIGEVTATGGDPEDLAQVLRLVRNQPLDRTLLRKRLATLSETQWYRSLWLNPGGSRDTVTFSLEARPAPQAVAGLSVAYNSDLGGKMWAGVVARRFLTRGLEGSGFLFLGRFRQELFLGLRNTKRLGSYAVTPALSVSGAYEDVRQFDADGNELPQIRVNEVVGLLGLERRFFGRWSVSLALEGRAWRESDVGNEAAGGRLRVMQSERNSETRYLADVQVTGVYRRAELLAAPRVEFDDWSIRPYVRLGWGQDLPAQLLFPLGGTAGFPGLHIGERLGDREVDVGGTVRYMVSAPLYVSAEVALGRTALGGSLFGSDGWLAGGRVGIGAETPIGPVAIDYGVTDQGRDLLMFRYGRWF